MRHFRQEVEGDGLVRLSRLVRDAVLWAWGAEDLGTEKGEKGGAAEPEALVLHPAVEPGRFSRVRFDQRADEVHGDGVHVGPGAGAAQEVFEQVEVFAAQGAAPRGEELETGGAQLVDRPLPEGVHESEQSGAVERRVPFEPGADGGAQVGGGDAEKVEVALQVGLRPGRPLRVAEGAQKRLDLPDLDLRARRRGRGVLLLARRRPHVGVPAVLVEIDPAARAEDDSFLLQEVAVQAFFDTETAARAHRALGIEHPLPGQVEAVGCIAEHLAHLPRTSGQAGESRHLAVGRHAAGRDAPHDGVDAFGGGGAGFLHGCKEFYRPTGNRAKDRSWGPRFIGYDRNGMSEQNGLRKVPLGVLAMLLLVSSVVSGADPEGELSARWQGGTVLVRLPIASSCDGFFNDNDVVGSRVDSKARHRFEAGEVARVDRINVKRNRVDVQLELSEGVLEEVQDGPFTLYDAKVCKVQLKVPVPDRSDGAAVDRRLAELLERVGSVREAEASPGWNGRRRASYPPDYEETLAAHAAWKAAQVNAAVQARMESGDRE